VAYCVDLPLCSAPGIEFLDWHAADSFFFWPSIVIIHQRRGYLGEWANADKIDLLVLLLNF
jgi:hypothetical protein